MNWDIRHHGGNRKGYVMVCGNNWSDLCSTTLPHRVSLLLSVIVGLHLKLLMTCQTLHNNRGNTWMPFRSLQRIALAVLLIITDTMGQFISIFRTLLFLLILFNNDYRCSMDLLNLNGCGSLRHRSNSKSRAHILEIDRATFELKKHRGTSVSARNSPSIMIA